MKNEERPRFKVIKSYPTEDGIAYTEYEGTIQELCIEMNKYIGGVNTRYRRLFEKQLYFYEQSHQNVHFKVFNMENPNWKRFYRKHLNLV